MITDPKELTPDEANSRYEELVAYYKEEIEGWDWDALTKTGFERVEDEEGVFYESCWLGSVFGLTPSGKFYMPWTTNQTDLDVTLDQAWWEALEAVVESKGMYIDTGDHGDGDGIRIGRPCAQPQTWEFTFVLRGTGDTEAEALDNAIEAFMQDPGLPTSSVLDD